MEYSPEEKVYIWLDSFPLEEREKRRLLSESGSPRALTREFALFRESLIKSAGESVYNNMLRSLSDGGKYFRAATDALKKEGISAVTRVSLQYPDALKAEADAPLVLYAKGDVSLLKSRMFTVVGSRRTPAAAMRIGAEICGELSREFAVVTGTTDGGDSAAVEGALQAGGKIVCVLPGGFSAMPQGNYALLSRVAEKGLLLSAHTFDTPVRAFSFESRNKLLARLGEGVLVLGAAEKSGALITARYAAQQNKPIFALPYFPGAAAGAGCNALIKKGACLTENSVDILGRFGINLLKEKNTSSLSDTETAALTALRTLAEAHVAEIAAKSGIPLFKLYGTLASLETKGLVMRLGGNRFAPV